MQCPNSNVFDEGQEVDIDLIDLPDSINRDELYDDNDDSSQASRNSSSQSSAQDMSGDEDDERLVHDDVSCTGPEKDLNDGRDNLVKEMYEHTLAWSTQRNYVQAKEKEAKADYGKKILWPYRHDMLVGDYAQTMDIPHVGGEQPGLTYYYSLVNFNVFGCVDYATEHM